MSWHLDGKSAAATVQGRQHEPFDEAADGGAALRQFHAQRRGRPVARVVPLVNKPRWIVGAMKGEIEVLGDIIRPLGARCRLVRAHPVRALRHDRKRRGAGG